MNRYSFFCVIFLLRTRFTFTTIIWLLRLLVFTTVVKEYGGNITQFETIYLRSGQDFNLSCDSGALGNISLLIWKWRNTTLRSIDFLSSNISDANTRLHLTNVSVADSGVYSCIGYSLTGSYLNHSKEVVVQVIPSSPHNLTLTPLSANALSASWASANANESIVLYALYLYQKGNLTAEWNLTAHRNEFTFHTLTPHTCYTLLVRALNNVGWSELTGPVHAMTLPGRLSIRPPVELLTVNQTHVSVVADHTKLNILVHEDASSPCSRGDTLFNTILHGKLNRYVVSVIAIGKPLHLSPIGRSVLPITNASKQVMVIGPLKPYTQYRLSFTFGSENLKGPVTHLNVTTSEGLPDPPVELSGNTTEDSVTLTWSNGPVNGRLTSYKLELYRCTGEEEMTVPQSSLRLRQAQIGPLRKQYKFDNLDPNACFAARVASATKVGLGNFSSLHQLYTDLPTPATPHLVSVVFTKSNNILVNWTCSPTACEGVPSALALATGGGGTTDYYKVCWSLPVDKIVPIDRHYGTPKCLNADTFLASPAVGSSVFCTCLSDATVAVRLPWSTVETSRSGRVIFSVRSGIKRKVCCTSPVCKYQCLKESPDSNVISLDLAGAPGYWRPTSHFQLDDTAIGGIAVVIGLVFVSVLLVACFPSRLLPFAAQPCWLSSLASCRGSQKTVAAAAAANSHSSVGRLCRPAPLRLNKPNFKPIQRDSLHSRVALLHADDGAGFQAEFEAIDRYTSADLTSHTARLPENIAKNRYSNVLAYDHSRVLLHDTGGKTDYINANFVDGYFHRSAYIATQGPIPTTFDDFWSMVWEHDCNVIVMISNFIERGRRKCDQYWPTGDCQVYGNISVRMVSETVRAFFTIRIFGIRHVKCKRNSKERVVFHYQYTDWRDFDVPSTPLPVLKFVENSVAHWSTSDGPIVVHCSAGVGRTGTYICIDSLIKQLKVEQCVSVRAFLEHIRQQRMKLVQTEQQYAFIYDALGEYVLNPSHKISPSLLSDHIEKLRALDSSGCSNLENLYAMCIGSKTQNIDSSSLRTGTSDLAARNSISGSSVGWWWNNNTSSGGGSGTSTSSGGGAGPIACDLGLVGQHSPTAMLHGHYSLCEYHVSRCPTGKTETADFWRMVWEENSPVIVCLLSPTDEKVISTSSAGDGLVPRNDTGDVDGDDDDGHPHSSVHGGGDDSPAGRRQAQSSLVFWPSHGQQSISVDWLQVTLVHSTAVSAWLSRLQFLLTSDREDYALSCTLWLFTAWPSGPPHELLSEEEVAVGQSACLQASWGEQLLQLVAKCGQATGGGAGAAGGGGGHDLSDGEEEAAAMPISGGTSGQRESTGPIMVVDSCDGHRAGIFCALRIAINQLLDEGHIDVYFVFKMICQQQPGIFRSYHDLEFIYAMMQQYVNHHLRPTQSYLPLGPSGFSAPLGTPQENGAPAGLAHLLGLPVKHQPVSTSCRQDSRRWSPSVRHAPPPPGKPTSRLRRGRAPQLSGGNSPEAVSLLADGDNQLTTEPVIGQYLLCQNQADDVVAGSPQSSQHTSLYSLTRAYLSNSAYSVNSELGPVESCPDSVADCPASSA